MVTRIDDESMDTPDWTVRCIDTLTTSDFDFAGWDFVGSDGLRPTTHAHTPAHATHAEAHATHAHAAHAQAAYAPQSEEGHRQHLVLLITPLPARSGQEYGLLSIVEPFELRQRAAKSELSCGRLSRPGRLARDGPRFDDVSAPRRGE